MLKYRRGLMREFILPVIAGISIVVSVVLFLLANIKSENCFSYQQLTGIDTTMIKGKCYKYADGQLQVIKELE